jgi:putative ABC transport system substrate-binding protein
MRFGKIIAPLLFHSPFRRIWAAYPASGRPLRHGLRAQAWLADDGQRAQAAVVVTDGMYLAERAKLQELMQTTRLPVAYALREHVVAGGLLSYGANLAANYRRAATYVDKNLKGAKPADLPVEQATKFELVINLKTARALGLTIPQSMLLRADEVIQ